MADDPYNGPGYRFFVAMMAKHCHCCPACRNPPCDGALAGGMCDQSRCRCDDESDDYEDEEDRP